MKHLNVHNSCYQNAVTYLLFEHDEQAHPIYNKRGKMTLRKNILIDALNTDIWSYAFDCYATNHKWHKNCDKREIKSHHFILSFSKEDADLHGLTPELAQELGMEYAQRHFSGHQCIIATHDDGSRHSGNIHVHITFNSVRSLDMPCPNYSDLERDYKAGFKFQASDQCIEYLKADLEQMCRAHGLSQIELNKPAKRKITDREYWTEKHGQRQLDAANKTIKAVGGIPSQTKFQTELEKIRIAIDAAKGKATSVENFKKILLQEYGISIRDARGRWSYKPSNRRQGVTARRLGDTYSMESVTAFISDQIECEKQEKSNANWAKQKQEKVLPLMTEEPIVVICAGKLYDISENRFQERYGLAQWAKLQNLKEQSRGFNILMEGPNSSVSMVKPKKK